MHACMCVYKFEIVAFNFAFIGGIVRLGLGAMQVPSLLAYYDLWVFWVFSVALWFFRSFTRNFW